MFEKILKKIDSSNTNYESWILSAIGIILIRIFLEQISSYTPNHPILIDISTIIHYSTFFLSVAIWCFVILLYTTKRTVGEISNIALYGLSLILIAPVVDILLKSNVGSVMHYAFLNSNDLLKAFLTMFWSSPANGITYGIRVEIIILVLLSFFIIKTYTKNVRRSLFGSFLIYLFIFISCSLPSILSIFSNITSVSFVQNSLLSSNIINNSFFSTQISNFERLLDVGFNSLMIQINSMLLIIGTFLISLYHYKKKILIIIKNSRPERILHYSIMILIGAFMAKNNSFFLSWINILSLVLVIGSFKLAWISAVLVNDMNDIEIDKISNPERPLPQNSLEVNDFKILSKLFFLFSLLLAYSTGLYTLFFITLFSVVYYIYSSYPLKIKRNFIGGIFTIGIATLSAVYSGFFLVNRSREIMDFQVTIALAIFLIFGIGSMIKDIKDYEGDKSEGIVTLPVFIGLKCSKIVISIIIMIGFLLSGFYLNSEITMVSSIICSILSWRIINNAKYNERSFFIIYIAFLVIYAIVFAMRL